MDNKMNSRYLLFATSILLVCIFVLALFSETKALPGQAINSCGLAIDIIAAPFAVVDSNMPGIEGPKVGMVGVRITNQGATAVTNITAYIGDGKTPGTFPIVAGNRLQLLQPTDSEHYLNDLAPGESKNSYWPITYPFTFDVRYPYTIWVTTPDGCSATATSTITTQSEISALANKLLPGGSQLTITPQTATPGSLIKVRLTGFQLGTIGQGPRPLSPYDAWLQPIGNLDFDPTCLRLVKSEVLLSSISATPFYNQLYFSGIRSYTSHSADYVEYSFLALHECTTTIQPYQEAASGTQEKYNGDYSDAISRIIVAVAGQAELQSHTQLSQNTAVANDTVVITTTFQTSSGSVGYPDAGSPVALVASIPTGTTYVSGSGQLSVAGDLQYSVNGGLTWQETEPVDTTTITDLRWILSEPVDANAETIDYSVTFSDAYLGETTTVTTSIGLLNEVSFITETAVINADENVELICTTDSTVVAYEDLKNEGWSDWDYNDFVVRIQANECATAEGNLARLEMEYEALARGAGFDHKFRHNLPIVGGGHASLTIRDGNAAVIAQTEWDFVDETDFVIFNSTKDALPPGENFYFTNTMPEQTYDIAGYTATLIVEMDDPVANPDFLLPPFPWDAYVDIYDTEEKVHLLIPGHLDNSQQVNGVYDSATPLMGEDLPLAQTFPSDWDWPLEYLGLWRGYPNYTEYLNSGGTTNLDWYYAENAVPAWIWRTGRGLRRSLTTVNTLETTSRYFAAPVAADLDQNGTSEIILGNMLRNQIEVYNSLSQLLWVAPVGGSIKAAPTVVDLTGDGLLEVVVGASDGYLYAFHTDGTAVAGWPIYVGPARILSTPAIVDLNGDGSLEIVVSLANGRLYVLNTSGVQWEASLGGVIDLFDSQVLNSSPMIADLDGDTALEIVVGSYDDNVYAFNADGTSLWVYPTGDIIMGTPAVADIDPDIDGLETAVGSGDGYLYLLDAAGNLIWKRDAGWIIRSSPVVVDMNPAIPGLEIIIGRDSNGYTGMVLAWERDGSFVTGWPQRTGANVFAMPRLGDIDGDGQLEIVAGGEDARVYAWELDGSLVSGWPRETAVSIKGAPVLLNLDGDEALEVVAADFGGNVYTWGQNIQTLFLPIIIKK